eukprot:TRINITY_DN5636_c1_g1_i1.p1 TRINITY_DN5636_c1_g1~~TRINITY_DN5636_c1_g1_i1.p1  ORF type:complete len:272 (-),score=79.58 TRINITY_DN5636_c1_g1_i1:378-1193(-)
MSENNNNNNVNVEGEENNNGLMLIGAGFGRCGTTSTFVALQKLGFKCYHMKEVFKNKGHGDFWYKKSIGEDVDFADVFDKCGYVAGVDWPMSTYYKELMEKYPEAKVILNVRDPEAWHKSCMSSIYKISSIKAISLEIFSFFLGLNRMRKMIDNIIWQGTFDGKFEDKEYAIKIFNENIEEVKQYVPEDRLLIFDVKKHGYKELCEFINVEPPKDEEGNIINFPHANTTEEFNGRVKVMQRFKILDYFLFAGLVSFFGASLYYLNTRYNWY